MKVKRFKHEFVLTYFLKDIDEIDLEEEFLNHFKEYAKKKDLSVRFQETGSGYCKNGMRDISYYLSSTHPWKFKELFRNMRRYLQRRKFQKIQFEILKEDD